MNLWLWYYSTPPHFRVFDGNKEVAVCTSKEAADAVTRLFKMEEKRERDLAFMRQWGWLIQHPIEKTYAFNGPRC